MREWTRAWWEVAVLRDELVTSKPVWLELERTPEPKRSLALLASLPLLDDVAAVGEIVAAYLQHQLMPRDAAGDARHLALATFHGCAIFAKWNCRHIANANKQEHIRRVNSSLGFATPVLTTPFELHEHLPCHLPPKPQPRSRSATMVSKVAGDPSQFAAECNYNPYEMGRRIRERQREHPERIYRTKRVLVPAN